MRGKRIGMAVDAIGNRIIPAHAGQTRCERCRRYGRADHPRACGANRRCAMVRQLAYGSSPRMRGKLSPTTSRYNFPRIIPAHAGQTAPYVHRTFCRADHPRACGANGGANCRRWHAIGSSPRMRGKPRLCTAAISALRIIPAHAGQTCGGRRGPACSADHPAHAGQTSGLTYPMPSVADHPRACGANFRVREVVDAYAGSSPRMRGKQGNVHRMPAHWRIIPAHAGQTPELCYPSRDSPDHPRACGANSLRATSAFITSGSSPRMRGKRYRKWS